MHVQTLQCLKQHWSTRISSASMLLFALNIVSLMKLPQDVYNWLVVDLKLAARGKHVITVAICTLAMVYALQ